ncbi:MAG: hypothetical protein HUJ26_18420 [Planctomycetaceae bacterium]|nr:hypothetical protein [Planctomycetaceae bacterium]
MRRTALQLIAVLLLMEMNLSILMAELPPQTSRTNSTTFLTHVEDVIDGDFVMPINRYLSTEEPAASDVVLPALPEIPEEIEQIAQQPHQLVDPDEVVGRSYNDIGWYSYPEWSRATWRPRSGDRIGEFSLEGRSASPIESWEGLSLTQGYGLHYLSGPNQTDLPPRLYDFQVGLHWFGEITDGFWLDMAVAGGLYTDFEDSVRDGWRVPAHAVLSWKIEEEFQPVLGFRYFDRNNLGFLPVAGAILKPDEDLRLELVYPEPRISWRTGGDSEKDHWISLAGRIGGGEWAIERAGSGLADVVTYNDYELTLGFETFETNQSISAVELGYTFDRQLRYRSNQGNYDPQETYFVRLSLRK